MTCTSLLLLGDFSMMSSVLLSVKGSPNDVGLLGVARLLSIPKLGRMAGLLSVTERAMS